MPPKTEMRSPLAHEPYPLPPADFAGLDVEYLYLAFFRYEVRINAFELLGANPSVHRLLKSPMGWRLNVESRFKRSVFDDNCLLPIPGPVDAWTYLRNVVTGVEEQIVGSRFIAPPPKPMEPGYCYLSLFEPYTWRTTVEALCAFPQVRQILSFQGVDRASPVGLMEQKSSTAQVFHIVVCASGEDIWTQLSNLPAHAGNLYVGADTPPPRSPSPHLLEISPTQETSTHPPRVDEPPSDQPFYWSTPPRSKEVSYDFLGRVLEEYPRGFCYLGAFKLEFHTSLKITLGENPTVRALMATPVHQRRWNIGVFSPTPGGAADYHVSYEDAGLPVWEELARLNLEDPDYRVGALQSHLRKSGGVWPLFQMIILAALFSFVLLRCLTNIYSLACLFLLTLPVLMSWMELRAWHSVGRVWSFLTGRWAVPDELLLFYRASSSLFSGHIFMCFGHFVLAVVVFVMRAVLFAWRVKRIRSFRHKLLRRVWHFTRLALYLVPNQPPMREPQADLPPNNMIIKKMLQASAAVLRWIALYFTKRAHRDMLESVAQDLQSASHLSDVWRLVTRLKALLLSVNPMLEKEDNAPLAADIDIFDELVDDAEIPFDQPAFTVPPAAREPQADDFPASCCKHLLTKGNIHKVSELTKECQPGSVHIITAATGTGKSTAIPYFLSQETQGNVYVVIPTVAATRSSSQVITARFGVRPHVQAESVYEKGDCNIWVVTSKTFVWKMVNAPQFLDNASAVIFDEMHVASAENHLFRELSPRLANRMKVMWCSATFAQSFTLPGDLSHTVVERIDPTVTLKNIFTANCKVRGVTPSTIRGRYLVFCASRRDTEIGLRKFARSGLPVFAVHSGNFKDVQQRIKDALEDRTKTTVIVFSTPVTETGVTWPLNYVVDLREQIVPKMNYDPNSLSTKRVPVTEGMAVQRKGRVGRLMRGIYIAPPVTYTPVTSISESDVSLASVYSRLFGVSAPVKREFQFLDDQLLTDAFLANVAGSRLDPIAIAGMTTPEGRFFKSFDKFTFDPAVNTKTLAWSPTMFPQSLWATWPTFDTPDWEQFMPDENRTQKGNTVRAPFWDYTADPNIQIDNFQLKVLCFRGKSIEDPIYNDPKFFSTKRATKLSSCWFVDKSRQDIGSLPSWARQHQFLWWFPDQPSTDPEAPEVVVDVPGQTMFENFIWEVSHAMPWVPYVMVFLYFVYALAVYWVFFIIVRCCARNLVRLVRTAWNAITDSSRSVTSPLEEEIGVACRTEEKLPKGCGPEPTSTKPKRVWEKKRRNWMPSGPSLDPDDFVVLDFQDGRGSRRCRVQDVEDELRNYYDDWDSRPTDWSDDYVQISGQRSDGTHWTGMYAEMTGLDQRKSESKLHVRTPDYQLKSARSSVVSILSGDKVQRVASGVIVRNFIIVNTHVAQALAPRLTFTSMRGTFEASTTPLFEDGDLTVLALPPGVAGSSANYSIRAPEFGERVCLVRFHPEGGIYADPTPSEESYTQPDETGLFGYSINTIKGDCGSPLVATRDGALVGIHGYGGSHLDQANFMAPISNKLLTEFNRRTAQSVLFPPINLPSDFSPEALTTACAVDVSTQLKKPVERLHDPEALPRFRNRKGGYVDLGFLRKHVSDKSKITLDQFAVSYFMDQTTVIPAEISGYAPAQLTPDAYWKDVAKFDRPPQQMPDDFFAVSELYWQHFCPWIFERVEIPPLSEVYYAVSKNKSSGPRLPHVKGHYMSQDQSANFDALVLACEKIYDVPTEDFVPPVWQIALKDELRDVPRVEIEKTRTFMSAPIETILGNMRFVSGFNERFLDQCLNFPSTLGVDKFRGGWTRLANHLGTSKRVYLAGDGSRFESTVGVGHMSLSLGLRMASLPTRTHRHLRNLYSETVYTPLVMADGKCRLKVTGNPSGGINTPFDNTIALISSVFWALTLRFGVQRTVELMESRDVVFVVNGDDLGMSIAEDIWEDDFPAAMVSGLKSVGMNFDFAPPTRDLEEFNFLGHGFKRVNHGDREDWLPTLEPARIVASCLYRRKDDAISTHSRYLSALIHAYPYPKLYPIILKMVYDHFKIALGNRPFLDSRAKRMMPLFSSVEIRELYGLPNMGSAGKTYSHKQLAIAALSPESTAHLKAQFLHNLTERIPQMAHLEQEHGEQPLDEVQGPDLPLREAGAADELVERPGPGGVSKRAAFGFTRGMDPSLADLMSSVISASVPERIIVAKSTRAEVERSIRAVRDFFQVDEKGDFSQLFARLLIYYGDNSTSERNPHTFPLEWKGQEYSWVDIDRCFRPTPRKFWRAAADITKKYLQENPDLEFHWSHMHGFPRKYRIYGFDCADFCSDIPEEARLAVQAAKDAALTRAPYNLMRADLKAVGFGGGTVVEQVTGSQFASRGPGRGSR